MRKDKSSTTLTAYTNTGYNDVTIAYFIRNGNGDQDNIEGIFYDDRPQNSPNIPCQLRWLSFEDGA